MINFEVERYLIDSKGGSEVDYSTFDAFESAVLDVHGTGLDNLIVVGIINPDPEILSKMEKYVSSKFYKYSTPNICFFTNSGLMLACKNNYEWILLNENFHDTLVMPMLKNSVLKELIDERIYKIFIGEEPEKEEQQIEEEREIKIDLILNSTFKEIAGLLATDIHYLDHIEWRDLERALGVALSNIGFNVEVTPPSKDGGKDIILSLDVYNDKYSFIIELKHWRSGKKVGPDYVEKFLRVVINERRSGGLFLASYGYSDDCLDRLVSFKRYNINLGDGNKIYNFFRIYKKTMGGLVFSPLYLLNILSENVIEAKDIKVAN